jgi:hypothetical protein
METKKINRKQAKRMLEEKEKALKDKKIIRK